MAETCDGASDDCPADAFVASASDFTPVQITRVNADLKMPAIGRTEVVNWKSLVDLGGYPGVREKGLLRLEGKEYVVKDGDVLVIRQG